MKKFTIYLLSIAIIVVAFSVSEAIAQKPIKLDKTGKAKISATIKPWKLGDIKGKARVNWSISGKQFSNLQIKQTKGEKFKFEIRRGGEFLSSGHTTGSNIRIKSDGKSNYTIAIINEEDKARPIVLSLQDKNAGNR